MSPKLYFLRALFFCDHRRDVAPQPFYRYLRPVFKAPGDIPAYYRWLNQELGHREKTAKFAGVDEKVKDILFSV
jgi:hypothetical protein